MRTVLHCAIFLAAVGTTVLAQGIPKQILGKWRIVREVPTSTISCWGVTEAKAILQTEIEYTTESFRWKNVVTKDPRVEIAALTAQQFHDENSGGSANSSQVSFRQLGIKAAKAVQIAILHPPAEITGQLQRFPETPSWSKTRTRSSSLFAICTSKQSECTLLGVSRIATIRAFEAIFCSTISPWSPLPLIPLHTL